MEPCSLLRLDETDGQWDDPPDMQQWAKPAYSRSRVDKAGQVLITPLEFGWVYPPDWDPSLDIINNWRSSHSYPLNSIKMGLLQRTKRVDDRAIVAQRLKRLSSIETKLKRNERMALSQMQDIGGCRAIVRNGRLLGKLVHMYDGSEHVKKFDYLAHPKEDGYRGAHFVCKYKSNLRQNQPYVGLRIEIQLRSKLQHAWATAVETVDTFTKQRIKTGGGEERWRRFFALMSSHMAIREALPTVPGTPTDRVELAQELRRAVNDLRVISVLEGWAAAVHHIPNQPKTDAEAFLLLLDAEKGTLSAFPFADEDRAKASEQYLAMERDIRTKPASQAVLVSVQSVRALRAAYPNYFADTRAFIDAVKRAVI